MQDIQYIKDKLTGIISPCVDRFKIVDADGGLPIIFLKGKKGNIGFEYQIHIHELQDDRVNVSLTGRILFLKEKILKEIQKESEKSINKEL